MTQSFLSLFYINGPYHRWIDFGKRIMQENTLSVTPQADWAIAIVCHPSSCRRFLQTQQLPVLLLHFLPSLVRNSLGTLKRNWTGCCGCDTWFVFRKYSVRISVIMTRLYWFSSVTPSKYRDSNCWGRPRLSKILFKQSLMCHPKIRRCIILDSGGTAN
jgi:hypothetical protein